MPYVSKTEAQEALPERRVSEKLFVPAKSPAPYQKKVESLGRKGLRKMSESKIKLLTIKEAANLIEGLTEYRIRQMCIDGTLPCFKAGKKYLINENKLIEFISNN